MDNALDKIDWTTVSPYLILFLYIIYNKWDSIVAIFKDKQEAQSDEREHHQKQDDAHLSIIRDMIGSSLDDIKRIHERVSAIEKLLDGKDDNQYIEILREMLAWAKDDFSRVQNQMSFIQQAVHRQNDLFSLLNMNISFLVDKERKRQNGS